MGNGLDTNTLTNAIAQAFTDQRTKMTDPDGATHDLAQKIATAVVNCVKNMKITYTAGLAAPNGAVTGTFDCTIS